MRNIFSLLILTLYFNPFLHSLTINNGWNLYGSGDSEIDLSAKFSDFENIKYIWIYQNGVWSGYGNNQSAKTKLSSSKIDQIGYIPPQTGFWVLNDGKSIDLDLSFYSANLDEEIVLNPNWTLVSSGGLQVDFNQTFGLNNSISIVWAFDNLNKVWKAYSSNSTMRELIRLSSFPEIKISDKNSAFWVLNSTDKDISLNSAKVPTLNNFDFWGEWKSIDSDQKIWD